MKTFKALSITSILITSLSVPLTSEAREQIRIVGSSTVFPFSTTVAENFGHSSTKFKTPIVESTGSGGGLKLFCAGLGKSHPDITNASRRIKKSEIEKCKRAGITPIEIKIGFDGIVLANSIKSIRLNLNLKDIFNALAKKVLINGKLVDNPYQTWQEVNKSLPNIKIEVLGPPPTSGTRDAFAETAMGEGAKQHPELKRLYKLSNKTDIQVLMKKLGIPSYVWDNLYKNKANKLKGKDVFKVIAYAMREDGAFIEAGENDNLIVQKLNKNPQAFGIFGFSFLEENSDSVQGSLIEGDEPSFENIADGKYKVSRSLFFYVKQQHLRLIPGIKQYVAEFTSETAWGDDGYLVDKGLIPLTNTEKQKTLAEIKKYIVD